MPDVHDQKIRLACVEAAAGMALPGAYAHVIANAQKFYDWVMQIEPKTATPPEGLPPNVWMANK